MKYEKRQACFVCTTPYQILGAIAIVLGKRIEADLYVFRVFKGCEEVAKQLNLSNIFKNVIIIDNESYHNSSRFRIFVDFIYAKRIYDKYIPNSICYDDYYSTSNNRRVLLLLYVLTKRNHSVRYIYYEDGLGTYVKGLPIITKSFPNYIKMLELAMRKKILSPSHSEILCTYPELVEPPVKVSTIPIKKMPVLDFHLHKDFLWRVFSCNVSSFVHERIIFFDEFRGYKDNERKLDYIDDIIEIAMGKYPHDMIYKSHPRSFYRTRIPVKDYENQSVPIEIVYTTMANLEQRVLIGNLSTALFTPKILFNVEPYVISTHRVSPASSKSDLESIYSKFESIYSNKSKICAPESREQFRQCLQDMMEGFADTTL